MNLPEAGDIHWADFGTTLGTEQAGRRPALVVSEHVFNARSSRIVVCPITSRPVEWPVVVPMPSLLRTRGVILCDQVRAIDRRARLFGYIERLPEDSLIAVRRVLGAILGVRTQTIGT
ncbi:MAG TPA: type II toxin-antitoxin system PemK/MazF family toxin [Beijerinckiaceae bacterium]|jgi:mRNA interferase MazF|nr:type II toxin-antitoxin system PemK/MazF family toxin [Beijerinckiaceae bacterium]